MLTYRRPLARDDQYDTSISTNQSQAVIWAMGPINSKVNENYLYFIVRPQWWSFADVSQQGLDFSKKISKTKKYF